MKPHNLVEEGLAHRCHRVRMPRRDEMCILGQSVHNRQHHGLAIDPWKVFNEVHRDVHPNRHRDRKRLQQPRRMKVLCLVALANITASYVFPHKLVVPRRVEGGVQTLEHFLNTFMAHTMGLFQHGWPQG
jgi:hypothetical protein